MFWPVWGLLEGLVSLLYDLEYWQDQCKGLKTTENRGKQLIIADVLQAGVRGVRDQKKLKGPRISIRLIGGFGLYKDSKQRSERWLFSKCPNYSQKLSPKKKKNDSIRGTKWNFRKQP